MKKTYSFYLLFLQFYSLCSFVNAQQYWQNLGQTLPETNISNTYDKFGSSIAVDGNYAVIGAPSDSERGDYFGAAYVFHKTQDGWQNIAKLTPSDGEVKDYFGSSVAISGNNIVVGTLWDPVYQYTSGGAYVFEKPESGWSDMTETVKLFHTPGQYGDRYGVSVSIHNNQIAVGATGDDNDGSSRGAVYIYEKINSDWEQTHKIISDDSDVGNGFGRQVSITENQLVASATGFANDDAQSGAIYIFNKNDEKWKTTARLTISDAVEYENIGYSLSVSESMIVAGSRDSNFNGDNTGTVIVFEKPQSGWEDTSEGIRLTPSDSGDRFLFGTSVSISGNMILVGSMGINISSNRVGAAYVFERPENGWLDAHESYKLVPPNLLHNKRFGCSVKFYDNQLFIGAERDDHHGYESGAAFVFDIYEIGINQPEVLHPRPYINSSESFYGNSIAMEGNYAVVGALFTNENGARSGAAYILEKDNENKWNRIAKLLPSDGSRYHFFGSSVSISGNTIVVSNDLSDARSMHYGLNSGLSTVYLYEKPVEGWQDMTETARLTASDGDIYDWFGHSVSISGNTVAVGAHNDQSNGFNNGSVYIFDKPDDGWKDMNETTKLATKIPGSHQSLGTSVKIKDNLIVAGAVWDGDKGAAYVFEKENNIWTQKAKLEPKEGEFGDQFGRSVDFQDDIIVIGSPNNASNGETRGSVYVFEKSPNGWNDMRETAKLTASDGEDYDYFGQSVSISGKIIAVGNTQTNGPRKGGIYIFKKPPTGWVDLSVSEKIVDPHPVVVGGFGFQVVISGNDLLVGDSGYNIVGGVNAGTVYYFRNDFLNSIEVTNNEQEFLKVYPNPGQNIIKIESKLKNSHFKQVQLFNTNGTVLLNSQGNVNQIDISDLPKGIYILKLSFDNEKHIVRKIIKN